MQPPLWQAVGPYLPNGAATTAVNHVVYFDAHAILTPMLILAGYAITGIVVQMAASRHPNRLVTETEPPI